MNGHWVDAWLPCVWVSISQTLGQIQRPTYQDMFGWFTMTSKASLKVKFKQTHYLLFTRFLIICTPVCIYIFIYRYVVCIPGMCFAPWCCDSIVDVFDLTSNGLSSSKWLTNSAILAEVLCFGGSIISPARLVEMKHYTDDHRHYCPVYCCLAHMEHLGNLRNYFCTSAVGLASLWTLAASSPPDWLCNRLQYHLHLPLLTLKVIRSITINHH